MADGGHAADRMGKKPVMAIAALGLVPVGFAWCFVSPSMAWLGYALSAAGAALWTGVEVANLNFVLEFSGSADGENGGSSYVAMNSVIIATHSGSSMTVTSTPRERSSASAPRNVWFSPTTTRGILYSRIAPVHMSHGDKVVTMVDLA